MVQVALIPPVSMLSYNKKQKYQLALPHMIKSNGTYRRAYRGYARTGKYVILDNGAAESVKIKADRLAAMALDLGVHEVVAPDVLADMEGTVANTLDFLRWDGERLEDNKVKIGIVAQGSNFAEAMACVVTVMRSYYAYRVSVVYLPRLLVTSKHPDARLMLAQAIHTRYPELEIHFLGASRKWLQEPVAMAEKVPFVRSIDTSVPFTEAYHGRLLGKTMTGLDRPDEYFEWATASDTKLEIIKKNVGRYLGWAKGESTLLRTAKSVH